MDSEELDQETIDAIAAAVPWFQLYQEQTYVFMAGYIAWLYYHITTLDEEVAYIWSTPGLKFGKMLVLFTRYSTTFAMVVDLFSYPNYLTISPEVCLGLLFTSNTLGMLSRASAEALIWLCLFALLKGKTKYLYLLVVLFMSFLIPIQVLLYTNLATRQASPLSFFDERLGWPCNFSPPLRTELFAAAGYIALTRALGVTIAGGITVFVRYRSQKNNLMGVIRREGGLYLISATLLILINGIVTTPGFPGPLSPVRWVIPALRWVFVTIFADRLLLQMRKVEDPGTRAVLTTLAFNHDNKPTVSLGTSEDFTGDINMEEAKETEDSAREKSLPEGSALGKSIPSCAIEESSVELKAMGVSV